MTKPTSIQPPKHKLLRRILLKFPDKQCENAYNQYTKSLSFPLLRCLSILSVFQTIVFTIDSFLQNMPLQAKILGFVTIGVVLLSTLLWKYPRVLEGYFAVCLIYYHYRSLDGFTNFDFSTEVTYMRGLVHGIFVIIGLLCFQLLEVKLVLLIISFVTQQVISPTWRTVPSWLTFSCIVYLKEIRDREIFLKNYTHQKSLEQFKDLIDKNVKIGILVADPQFEKNIFRNQVCEQFLKETKLEKASIELQLSGFKHHNQKNETEDSEDQVKTLYNFIQEYKKGNTNIEKLQNIQVTYESSEEKQEHRNFIVSIRDIMWGEKNPAYAIIFNDISQQERIHALEIADKHKDRLIATVSHEFRTPINGILGMLKILQDDYQKCLLKLPLQLQELQDNTIKNCNSLCKHLLFLVNSILDLSQMRNKKLNLNITSFNLDELLEEVKSIYSFNVKFSGVELLIDVGEGISSEIKTDRYRFMQILVNLIGNAFKFTFEGSITVKIRKVGEQDRYKLKCDVIDTGLGIKKENLSVLFSAFGKIKQENSQINSQGVGLGLSISNELVKVMNDNDSQEFIKVESVYGQGTTFSFRIPYETKEAPKSEAQSKLELDIVDSSQRWASRPPVFFPTKDEIIIEMNEKQQPQEPVKPTILIADDNPFNIHVLQHLLKQFDCDVTKALNGVQVLDILKSKQKNYDLLLCDIQMPVMDGLETLKNIQGLIKEDRIQQIECVAVTANDVYQFESYLKLGFVDVIEKPIKEQKIQKLIENILNQKKKKKNF